MTFRPESSEWFLLTSSEGPQSFQSRATGTGAIPNTLPLSLRTSMALADASGQSGSTSAASVSSRTPKAGDLLDLALNDLFGDEDA